MYIVHVTTELAPIAKVGGLGDMIQGLGKALVKEGELVEVILPFYDTIDKKKLSNLKVEMEELSSFFNMGTCKNTVWSAELEGLKLILIKPHHEKGYFDRGKIYGEEDDKMRFIYFSRAALEYLLKARKHPDILNLHDWLTGLCAPLYREVYQPLGLRIKKIITTIHNMQYQGKCSPEQFASIGLHPDPLLTKDKLQDHQDPEKLNILKGAIVYSDFLTTVSPSYAQEVKREKGFGLGPLLTEHSKKLKGILNGIDTEYWNPATDPMLYENYESDPNHLQDLLDAKKANRKHLSKRIHIQYDKVPLFSVVTRLVKQKGPELIQHGLEYALKKGGQFILLGTPYEEDVKTAFYALREEYRDNPHIHFHFEYDEALAHATYASADFILIPSIFEPCGLTQMIALRYGTIPIVHKVGGLKDTIYDIDHEEIPLEERNGYTFDFPSQDSLNWSIDRAYEHFKHDESKRLLMLKNGLGHDWSWKTSALTYLELYHLAIAKSR
ncbi:glycogen synthase [Simkania negevensis]|uniref:Glycogen synthase n=1 Tax=Simkania negevensis (strain ATCC VR-1471 / DSM 27360 / Z) TaxID=331113 RepID=F8L353_SIMNZ|nr:glycogen synthase [Simkania negevensis]CCB89691.1 glycogen synthase [Simkania negevensis Z]